ncbi:MAG TPA: acyl carrier protein [Planctomycetota bacterium]|nr:acyl carrier protein [Planctomycetota bacterium]
MTQEEIFAGVQQCLADALDIEPERIHEDDRVIGDLGADSLDLLDLTFRLEQRFKVHLSPREFERRARERLGGQDWQVDGVYTPAALAELRAAMPEIPPEELPDGLAVAEMPRRFRVATLVNLVDRGLKEPGDQLGGASPATSASGEA